MIRWLVHHFLFPSWAANILSDFTWLVCHINDPFHIDKKQQDCASVPVVKVLTFESDDP